MKPLFIPLKTEFYERFLSGEKNAEYRLYGPRWNEHTCAVGRPVVLSKGYGKQNRIMGRVVAFHKRNASTFGSTVRADILACYGTLEKPIAEIRIAVEGEE